MKCVQCGKEISGTHYFFHESPEAKPVLGPFCSKDEAFVALAVRQSDSSKPELEELFLCAPTISGR